MRRILIAAFILGVFCAPSRAAELVMFERKGCAWCEAFDREVAVIYAKTPEGARAPLRRVDAEHPPADLAAIAVERFTPVFVLLDGTREVGRIRGYPGQENFWGLLGSLLSGLGCPAKTAVEAC
jgi:thioredoxin-related protein